LAGLFISVNALQARIFGVSPGTRGKPGSI
jgi:hypothetical protein